MEEASLELCKELFEVSGWEPENWYHPDEEYLLTTEDVLIGQGGVFRQGAVAAYDLGYLLRKLPSQLTDGDGRVYLSLNATHDNLWCARYADAAGNRLNIEKFYADTPEDAAAKLAIELFKQGIFNPTNNQKGK